MGDRRARAVFVSDVHLGSRFSQAAALAAFLRDKSPDFLYLVGDIIDGWKFRRRAWHWGDDANGVIRRVLKMSEYGTRIRYAVGNHDEFLRKFFHRGWGQDRFGSIEFGNHFLHEGLDGRVYLVIHGDAFDTVIKYAPWVAWIGDAGYEAMLRANRLINAVRERLGYPYWSFSRFVKHHVKEAVNHISHFEEHLAEMARRKGCQGVIAGHIHSAADKDVGGVRYVNCGDWVESCTAVVEYDDGSWEILTMTGGTTTEEN